MALRLMAHRSVHCIHMLQADRPERVPPAYGTCRGPFISSISMNDTGTTELAPAWELFEQHDLPGAIAYAQPYLESERAELRQDAARLLGLALFDAGEYAAAMGFMTRIAEHCDAALDWFNLATAATMAGEVDQGEEAMERAVLARERSGDDGTPGVPSMRLYYAHALADVEEYGRALDQLNLLRDLYAGAGSSDAAVLELHGLPPLASFILPVLKVFAGLGDEYDGAGWLESFAAMLDENGRALIADVRARLGE